MTGLDKAEEEIDKLRRVGYSCQDNTNEPKCIQFVCPSCRNIIPFKLLFIYLNVFYICILKYQSIPKHAAFQTIGKVYPQANG